MIRIHAERDSVCMGDDVMAPNADDFCFPDDDKTDELLNLLRGYVPEMRNVVWEVTSNRQVVGYLISDETGKYEYENADTFRLIEELPPERVFCSYFYEKSPRLPKGTSEGSTLLERVKSISHD